MNNYNSKYQTNPNKSPFKSIIYLCITILILGLVWNAFNFFGTLNSTPANSPKEYTFNVEQGDNFLKIGDTLQKNNIITSPLALQYIAQTSQNRNRAVAA